MVCPAAAHTLPLQQPRATSLMTFNRTLNPRFSETSSIVGAVVCSSRPISRRAEGVLPASDAIRMLGWLPDEVCVTALHSNFGNRPAQFRYRKLGKQRLKDRRHLVEINRFQIYPRGQQGGFDHVLRIRCHGAPLPTRHKHMRLNEIGWSQALPSAGEPRAERTPAPNLFRMSYSVLIVASTCMQLLRL